MTNIGIIIYVLSIFGMGIVAGYSIGVRHIIRYMNEQEDNKE